MGGKVISEVSGEIEGLKWQLETLERAVQEIKL